MVDSSSLWPASGSSKHVSNIPGREFIVCANSSTLSFPCTSEWPGHQANVRLSVGDCSRRLIIVIC